MTTNGTGSGILAKVSAGLAWTIITGLCSLAFAVGVYVGRVETAVRVASLDARLDGHIGQVNASIAIEFTEIKRRLDNIERRLERQDD